MGLKPGLGLLFAVLLLGQDSTGQASVAREVSARSVYPLTSTPALRQAAGQGVSPSEVGPFAVSWYSQLPLGSNKSKGEMALFYPSLTSSAPDPAAGPAPVVVLVQGGAVAEQDYYYLGDRLASWGFVVAIPAYPRDLAVYGPNRTSNALTAVISLAGATPGWENFLNYDALAVGGHSLGGVVADGEVEKDDRFTALFLLASYPGDEDGANFPGPVLSIGGTDDCAATVEEVQAGYDTYAAPKSLTYIDGMTHYQFTASDEEDLQDCPPGVALEVAHNHLSEVLVSWMKVYLSGKVEFLQWMESPSSGITWTQD